MDASHRSTRDDFEISCPELGLAVETACSNGALGAHMTGGFGGSAIALVPAGSVEAVSTAASDAFRVKGFGSPDCFAVLPGAPACRDL